MSLTYINDAKVFVWRGGFETKELPKVAKFRWHPENRAWWTDDVSKAAKLAEYADEAAQAQILAWKGIIEASRASDSDLGIPVPAGLEYLPYQRGGIAYVEQAFRVARPGCLIGDEMGLGKTIQAIGFANLHPEFGKILVICPASLKLNWQKEWQKWDVHGRSVGLAASKGGLPKAQVTVVNWDILTKLDLSGEWGLIVADESHYAKNEKAQRTKAFQALKGFKLYLTGTPILNRPRELWTTVQALDPEGLGKNWFGFGKRYCNGHQVWIGRKAVWDFSGSSNLGELQERLRTTCMVRRLKSDVLPDLPEKRRQVIELEQNGAASIIKREAEAWERIVDQIGYEEAVRRLEAGDTIDFQEMSEIRHELGLAKVEKAYSHLENLLESTDKVVVFCHHRAIIDSLFEALAAFNPVRIYGGIDVVNRQAAVNKFQNDPTCRVFIGGIKAAGVGITLTAASTVVMVEQDWTPGWSQQAEDRCHRIGQHHPVLIQYLVFDGTLDAALAHMNVNKAKVITAALDDEVVIDLRAAKAAVDAAKSKLDSAPPAPSLTRQQINAIHFNLQALAAVCDGASAKDERGFNGLDSKFGKKLASLTTLSSRQADAARQMLRKYHGQLGREAINAMF